MLQGGLVGLLLRLKPRLLWFLHLWLQLRLKLAWRLLGWPLEG